MKKLVLLFSGILLISCYSMSQTSQMSIFSKNQKFDHEGIEIYSTNSEMKTYKKIGLGVMVGSATGLVSFNAEVNLDSFEALTIGLGTGPSYGAFSVGWKHNFEAQYFSPYTKLGYSRWYSVSGSSAADSDVLKRLYSETELKSGRFGADFLIAGAGVEYNQLEGELSGINLIGEIVMMNELSKSTMIPNGGVGIIYYY